MSRRVAETEEYLREYFENAATQAAAIELQRFVAAGTYSLTWKLQYRIGDGSQWGPVRMRDVLVKTQKPAVQERVVTPGAEFSSDGIPANEFSSTDSLANEKGFLYAMRSAEHFVKLVTFPELPRDPLLQAPQYERESIAPDWIYLEWIENGTLWELIRKAGETGVEFFPNRLLWRFFMCLIRMCIGMAWPPDPLAGQGQLNPSQPRLEQVLNAAPSGIVHGDIHNGNVMIGPIDRPTSDYEHHITPRLKMIDGGAVSISEEERDNVHQDPATTENLFAIGMIMATLSTLDEDLGGKMYPERPDPVMFTDVRPFATAATELLPPQGPNPGQRDRRYHIAHQWLDPDLLQAIVHCLAVNPHDRPFLAGLASGVQNVIQTRDDNFYEGFYERNNINVSSYIETDDYITEFMQQLIMDPAIPNHNAHPRRVL
ncbi:hypothetical protein F4677DRAFT_450782 [Hypoxylon crocopeplum]|nr:hypothetical protein F4677DRAFT_450782 [Hypoxylon crocopeplum]